MVDSSNTAPGRFSKDAIAAPIVFGTSGWRGVSGDDFTLPRVRIAVGAFARWLAETSPGGEVVVALVENVEKRGGTFTTDERLEMLREVLAEEPAVRVESFSGLVVDFAEQLGAAAIIRGLRAMSDFEYEFEMALMNKHLYPEIETVFMMASQEYLYVSSSRLKELVQFGRDVSEFVPAAVAQRLKERLGRG